MNKRNIGIGIGIILIITGLIFIFKIPYFYYHSHFAVIKLIKSAKKTKNPKFETTTHHSVSNIPVPSRGALIGTIHIPSLSLTAPILEGTTDKVLGKGAGHLTTSVMPGEVGTSIVVAHNVTWFRHVDQLKKGSLIQIQTNYG